MTRDHVGLLLWIAGGEDGLDLGERHVELPQLLDDLGGRDLLGRVVPVTRGRVDGVWLQEFGGVVAPRRPHAQPRHRGESTMVRPDRIKVDSF